MSNASQSDSGPASAHSSASARTEDTGLHFGLIEMVFALALGEIAQKFGDYFSKSDFSSFLSADWLNALPFFSHLLLATMVVACSWIGWGNIVRNGGDPIETVFEWKFIELLVDLALVLLYFTLIHLAEVPDHGKPLDLAKHLYGVAVLVPLIFITYAGWDRLNKSGDRLRIRIWATLVCLALSIAFTLLVCLLIERPNPIAVATTDLAFLSVVLLFRSLKSNDLSLSRATWGKHIRAWHFWACLLAFFVFASGAIAAGRFL